MCWGIGMQTLVPIIDPEVAHELQIFSAMVQMSLKKTDLENYEWTKISIITLNVHRLNSTIRRHRVAEGIKKE